MKIIFKYIKYQMLASTLIFLNQNSMEFPQDLPNPPLTLDTLLLDLSQTCLPPISQEDLLLSLNMEPYQEALWVSQAKEPGLRTFKELTPHLNLQDKIQLLVGLNTRRSSQSHHIQHLAKKKH